MKGKREKKREEKEKGDQGKQRKRMKGRREWEVENKQLEVEVVGGGGARASPQQV